VTSRRGLWLLAAALAPAACAGPIDPAAMTTTRLIHGRTSQGQRFKMRGNRNGRLLWAVVQPDGRRITCTSGPVHFGASVSVVRGNDAEDLT
jgi:hypothetical protein